MVGDEDGDERAAEAAKTGVFRIRQLSDLRRLDAQLAR